MNRGLAPNVLERLVRSARPAPGIAIVGDVDAFNIVRGRDVLARVFRTGSPDQQRKIIEAVTAVFEAEAQMDWDESCQRTFEEIGRQITVQVRSDYGWNKENTAFLKENYGKMPLSALARRLGFSRGKVAGKAFRLGLCEKKSATEQALRAVTQRGIA